MAWYQREDKPLIDRMMTQIMDACMRHSALVN